jgi:OFA family oxalate/formate antiporter-like MFS transporter
LNEKLIGYGRVAASAATGINLVLGSLYAWSIIKSALESELGMDAASAAIPYTLECLVFAILMAPAGKFQDRFGPRVAASLGGLLFGAGFIVSSFCPSSENPLLVLLLGFGVLTGAGTALGYASTTPAAIKWFPPEKHGLVIGIVVGGVGMAAVYVAPLTEYLLNSESFGLKGTFRMLGLVFSVAIILFAQLLKNPPEQAVSNSRPSNAVSCKKDSRADRCWNDMLKTPQFYLLWTMFFFGAGAGLMVISFAKSMAVGSIKEIGFALVIALAAGNASGRVVSGLISDKIGRIRAMLIVFIFQAATLAAMSALSFSPFAVMAGVVLVGFNYGSCLSLFPAITADYFGLKNLGANYGVLYTAWGVGSIFATVAGKIKVATGSYTPAMALAAVLCLVAAILSLLVKAPRAKSR